MLIDCATSLTLLSEYHDGTLGEVESAQVRIHLSSCKPCLVVFTDLKLIVLTAVELRDCKTIDFPDETVLWRRLEVVQKH